LSLYARLDYYEPPLPPSRPGALVWYNAIFANKRDLSHWLRQHGSSYVAWKKLHPAAAKFLEPNKHPIKLHGTKAAKTQATKARPAHKVTHATTARAGHKVTPPKTRNALYEQDTHGVWIIKPLKEP